MLDKLPQTIRGVGQAVLRGDPHIFYSNGPPLARSLIEEGKLATLVGYIITVSQTSPEMCFHSGHSAGIYALRVRDTMEPSFLNEKKNHERLGYGQRYIRAKDSASTFITWKYCCVSLIDARRHADKHTQT